MNPKKLSIISALTNLALAALKLFAGLASHSVALIAEALHSGLDIASSVVTYFGIRTAEKPKDKEHPYGHGGYEGIASFVVSLLLFASAVWILYEAVSNLLSKQHDVHFTVWGIVLMAFSIIINEILARFKFKSSAEFSSLALASDAEHSRADVISSVAVLIGLFLVKYFSLADSILAGLVAVYIFYEAYSLSREAIDSLVDKANPELEEKIIAWLNGEAIGYSDVKTRQVGSASFAEIDLIFDPKEKAGAISSRTKSIEQRLLESFQQLKQVSLSVQSHEFSENITRSSFGGAFRFHRRMEHIGPPKSVLSNGGKVKRVIVPLDRGDIADDFGSKEYLMVDIDGNGNTIQKTTITNKFYESGGAGHGTKFARSVLADEVIVKSIGEQAKKNLNTIGIKVKEIDSSKRLKDINYERT